MLPQPWPVQSQHNIPTLCLRTSTRWAIISLNFDCFVHWAFHTHLNRCASQHKFHLIHNETKLHQQKWKIIIIVPSSDRPYIDRYGSSNWTRCCNINFFKLKYVKILTELGTNFISTHVVILEWACKIIWMKLGTEKGLFLCNVHQLYRDFITWLFHRRRVFSRVVFMEVHVERVWLSIS